MSESYKHIENHAWAGVCSVLEVMIRFQYGFLHEVGAKFKDRHSLHAVCSSVAGTSMCWSICTYDAFAEHANYSLSSSDDRDCRNICHV